MIVDDSRWHCMLAGGQTEGHASTIIDYHEPLALINIESRWANMVWSLVYYKVNTRGLQWRKFHIAKSDLVWNLRLSNKFLYACTVIRFLRLYSNKIPSSAEDVSNPVTVHFLP